MLWSLLGVEKLSDVLTENAGVWAWGTFLVCFLGAAMAIERYVHYSSEDS
jgi:hypothetical protein